MRPVQTNGQINGRIRGRRSGGRGAARVAGALAICAAVTGACAPKQAAGLISGERGRVVAAQPGGRLRLQNGMIVRLAALETPRPWESRDLMAQTEERLAALTVGRQARLFYEGQKRDAHGAALAQVFVKTEAGGWVWVQQMLVGDGFARVRTDPDERRAAGALLAAEYKARAAKKGVWSAPVFAIRPANPDVLAADLGRFVLVDGRVVSAVKRNDQLYLNFGADYRTDFTAVAPEAAWIAWPGGAPDLLELQGARVRIRGVLEARNGPSLELTHPEQIEILEAPVPESGARLSAASG